jgi:hypothetical protein
VGVGVGVGAGAAVVRKGVELAVAPVVGTTAAVGVELLVDVGADFGPTIA